MPPNIPFEVELLGELRPMCCVGCLAVAETLRSQGLERWYETREAPSGAPAELVPDVLERSDFLRVEEADERFATTLSEGGREASLLVSGMTCAACVWVIERALEKTDGILEASVSSVSHRLRVRWDPERCRLESIVTALAAIGFAVRPDEADEAVDLARQERRAALVRLGIAGLATMNVMTYAVALWVGDGQGMSEASRSLFRWLAWLVATPVVCVSAAPFFRGAMRDLRVLRPGMDVPVALAIASAYVASAVSVIRGTGSVYFESVCMFTLFLSIGRFVEMEIRHRAAERSRSLAKGLPVTARRIQSDREKIVGIESIEVGDRLRVRAGESIPVDGRVWAGAGRVEEAVLTGEPWPHEVAVGDLVRAGSIVAEAVLEIEATSTSKDSSLASLSDSIDRAQADKPPIAQAADRVATCFVGGVLVLALFSAGVWAWIDPTRVFEVTLAVLVATCPCALGLATPTAIAAATEGLARRGFVITRAHALETLALVDRVIFDKTGTLSEGRPRVERTVSLRDLSAGELLARASALEAESSHVLARAFSETGSRGEFVAVSDQPGLGVEGKLAARRHRIGRPDWVAALSDAAVPEAPSGGENLSWVLLGDEEGPLAWFGLGDPVRAEAPAAMAALRARGLRLELLSGDPSAEAARVAAELGLEKPTSASAPEDKLRRVRALAGAGEHVAFVGDGLNDGPVVRAAHVSIAMGGGCDRTRMGADALLWHDDLSQLPEAFACASRTRRIIRQNFGWALAYNVCVLPLAVTGQLAPWLAALGMSASSLVVVANSARLRRREKTA